MECAKFKVGELVKQIRDECLKKGQGGIKHLGVIFRAMDSDFSKRLCFEEFKKGILMFGIDIPFEDLKLLFDAFDRDKNNHVDFAELVAKLRPTMPKSRMDVIQEAFDTLDVIKDNEIKMDDLKSKNYKFENKILLRVPILSLDSVIFTSLHLFSFMLPNEVYGFFETQIE